MIKKAFTIVSLVFLSIASSVFILGPQQALAAPCPGGGLLGLPSWHKHLDGVTITVTDTDTGENVTTCTTQINGLDDTWKIVAAVLEILLRVASLIAIGFVVFGGVTYITSQGAPDKTKQALQTIISALVGLVITIVASAVVGFIAGRFDSGENLPASSAQPTCPRTGPC